MLTCAPAQCRCTHPAFPADLTELEQDAVVGIHEAIGRLAHRARARGLRVRAWELNGGDTAMVALPFGEERDRFGELMAHVQLGRADCTHDDFGSYPFVVGADGSSTELRVESDFPRMLGGRFGVVGLLRNTKRNRYKVRLTEPWAPLPGLTPSAAKVLDSLIGPAGVTDLASLRTAAQVAQTAATD